jgi:agmatinase
MAGIYESRLYRPTRTFMGVSNRYELKGAKAAILGVPFDCGVHPTRIGARLGPSAIREQSPLVRPYQPPQADFNPLERLGLVDCGDVNVTSSLVLDAFERIEEAVWRIVEVGAVPITMGGDGAVTLPQLRALHRKHPDLVVLHIDAHTDTYPGDGEPLDKYNNATTFTRAAEEGILDTRHSIHIGARGPTTNQHIFEHTREFGYELIDGIDLFQRGIPATLVHIHERLAGRPVYLCFDMDFFDPSCAPGVCTPAWGGATAREGLQLLQGLAGLDIVAADVNTVSPPHDVGGMTAFLAGTVILECLTLVARALKLTNEPRGA